MPDVASPPVNLTCFTLLSMALPMRSTFVSLTSPYRSRGCLLSWCPLNGVQAYPGECSALTHKVNKLLTFFPAESTDFLGAITCYIMVIMEVIVPRPSPYKNSFGPARPVAKNLGLQASPPCFPSLCTALHRAALCHYLLLKLTGH